MQKSTSEITTAMNRSAPITIPTIAPVDGPLLSEPEGLGEGEPEVEVGEAIGASVDEGDVELRQEGSSVSATVRRLELPP
jgi:hypothetical protein